MSHVEEAGLAAYLDGELDPRERVGIEGHLAACADCRARLEETRRVRDRAQAILRGGGPMEQPAPSFDELVRRREVAGDRRRLGQLRQLAWAASVVLALGVGWYARQVSFRSPAPTVAPVTDATPLASRETAEPPAASRGVRASSPTLVADTGVLLKREADVAGDARRDAPAPAPTRGAAPVAAAPRQQAPAAAPPAAPSEPELAIGNIQVTSEAKSQAAALRAAPPEAVGARERAELQDELAPGWTAVTMDRAIQILDRHPLEIAGLPVVGYAARAEEPNAVRVTQQLGAGTIELVQRRAPVEAESRAVARAPAGRAANEALRETAVGVTVERDGIRVTGTAPVSADSLRVLLSRLR